MKNLTNFFHKRNCIFIVAAVIIFIIDILFIVQLLMYDNLSEIVLFVIGAVALFVSEISALIVYLMCRGKKQSSRLVENNKLFNSILMPHFVFNTLYSIQALCYTSPDEAVEAVGNFSVYLRQSLHYITSGGECPLSQELEVVKAYLDLQKKMCGVKINIAVEKDCPEAKIPAFGLIPFAHQAILRVREINEGEVIVSVYERENVVEISIVDNGKSDVNSEEDLAFADAKERLKSHGKIHFDSESGKNSVTISLVKQA